VNSAQRAIADDLDASHDFEALDASIGRWLMAVQRLGRFEARWTLEDVRYLASAGRARWEEISSDQVLRRRPRTSASVPLLAGYDTTAE